MKHPASAWPVGEGEMARRIREHDWAQTSFGPIDDWPPSLKTIVQLMLGSKVIMVAPWGPKGILIYNDPYSRLIGPRSSEALGCPVFEILPELQAVLEPQFAEVRAGRAVSISDQYYPFVRTTVLEDAWFDVSHSPIRSETGEIIAILTTLVETTARVEAMRHRDAAETALRLSQERFHAYSQATPSFVWISKAPTGELIYVNDRWYEYSHQTREQSAGFGWIALTHPDDWERNAPVWERCQRTGEIYAGEMRYRRHDGEYRWFTFRALPTRNEAGELDAWYGTSIDVHDQKMAEEQLRASEDRLRLAQLGRQVGVWDWNVKTDHHEWSPELELAFGIQPQTVRSYEEFRSRVYPDDIESMEAQRDDAILNRQPFDLEFRIVLPTGEVRWLSERGRGFYDEHDDLVRVAGNCIDITGRKQADIALREADQRKDEFLAMLGHELRNPLAAISTALQVLPEVGSLAQRAELEALMTQQVSKMQRLLDDLLDLARITHGHIELREETLDLGFVLNEAAAVIRAVALERKQHLQVTVPSSPVRFTADPVRLQQVLGNLLSNASKYSPLGGRIELSGDRESAEIVVRCKDDGQGISQENLEQIFEPFRRGRITKLGYGEASLGIGLTMARQLVRLHGGTLTATSGGPELGSEFIIRLPLVTPLQNVAVEMGPAKTAPPRGRSIVLVEDNPAVARTMKIALEQAKHRVHAFSDGTSVLAAISTLKPDAVLLDIGLPDMDGHELAARLKQFEHLRNAVFVAISGFNQKPVAAGAGNFDHTFLKPVEVKALLTLLETHEGAAALTHLEPQESAPLRVLLVEDDLVLRAVTLRLLQYDGVEIRLAATAKEALDVAQEFRPQLVLCDLNLPDANGFDVTRALKSGPNTKHCRALIVTAASVAEIQRMKNDAANLCVDDFLSKPLTPAVFRALVTTTNR